MKSIFNKTALLASLVLGSLMMAPAAQAAKVKANFDGCTPERTMYFAYTEKGTKAVEFCEVAGGYRYTFGPINKPELQVVKKAGEIGISNPMAPLWLTMRNGDMYYTVGSSAGGFSWLKVTKGGLYSGKTLAKINLDDYKRPYVNNLLERSYPTFEE